MLWTDFGDKIFSRKNACVLLTYRLAFGENLDSFVHLGLFFSIASLPLVDRAWVKFCNVSMQVSWRWNLVKLTRNIGNVVGKTPVIWGRSGIVSPWRKYAFYWVLPRPVIYSFCLVMLLQHLLAVNSASCADVHLLGRVRWILETWHIAERSGEGTHQVAVRGRRLRQQSHGKYTAVNYYCAELAE